MQADGPVNALAVDSSVLELFWSLASLDARTREARSGAPVTLPSPELGH